MNAPARFTLPHWRFAPSLDGRTWLSLAQRGVRNTGHTGAPETCPLCLSAVQSPAKPAPPRPQARPPVAPAPPARKRAARPMPTLPPGLAIADIVLLAAASIRLRGAKGFVDGDLVVRAWQAAPRLFALPGHPEHPHSQKVLGRLYGCRGLVAAGHLELVDVRTYRVTTKGRNTARRIYAARGAR